MKPNTLSLVLFALLTYFALSPKAQAVSPPPDGGYAGGNTAEGQNALLSLTSGIYNTGVGWASLSSTTTGQFNTAIGAGALFANTGGEGNNTAVGAAALFSSTTGEFNTANGAFALFSNTTGNGNTAVGYYALGAATGDFNIALGNNAGAGVTTATSVICIGALGNNVDNACYIGNIFDSTSSGGIGVFVNPNGRLGTRTSSARFNEDIKPMNHASDALYALKPITFRYKKQVDAEGTSAMQFGLVAEEVEKVNPDLVVRDREGKPYSVRYDQVNAMLLNEFLKAHKKMEEQELTIGQLKNQLQATAAKQQKQIEALNVGLQKMSAQLELSKPAPQTVKNTD